MTTEVAGFVLLLAGILVAGVVGVVWALAWRDASIVKATIGKNTWTTTVVHEYPEEGPGDGIDFDQFDQT